LPSSPPFSTYVASRLRGTSRAEWRPRRLHGGRGSSGAAADEKARLAGRRAEAMKAKVCRWREEMETEHARWRRQQVDQETEARRCRMAARHAELERRGGERCPGSPSAPRPPPPPGHVPHTMEEALSRGHALYDRELARLRHWRDVERRKRGQVPFDTERQLESGLALTRASLNELRLLRAAEIAMATGDPTNAGDAPPGIVDNLAKGHALAAAELAHLRSGRAIEEAAALAVASGRKLPRPGL
jgi:hypothetical protein